MFGLKLAILFMKSNIEELSDDDAPPPRTPMKASSPKKLKKPPSSEDEPLALAMPSSSSGRKRPAAADDAVDAGLKADESEAAGAPSPKEPEPKAKPKKASAKATGKAKAKAKTKPKAKSATPKATGKAKAKSGASKGATPDIGEDPGAEEKAESVPSGMKRPASKLKSETAGHAAPKKRPAAHDIRAFKYKYHQQDMWGVKFKLKELVTVGLLSFSFQQSCALIVCQVKRPDSRMTDEQHVEIAVWRSAPLI